MTKPTLPKIKWCPQCKTPKPLEAFTPCKTNKSNGRQSYCKPCSAAYYRGRYKANPEKDRESSRKWYKAHAAQKREEARAYRKARLEQIKEGKRKWCENNPARRVAARHRHRARKAGTPAQLTAMEWCTIIDSYRIPGTGFVACAYCGESIDVLTHCLRPNALTQEHVIALSAGGLHDRTNVVPAHRICNGRKGTKPGWTPLPPEVAGHIGLMSIESTLPPTCDKLAE